MPTIEEITGRHKIEPIRPAPEGESVVLDPNSEESIEDIAKRHEERTFLGSVEAVIEKPLILDDREVPIPFGGLIGNIGEMVGNAGKAAVKVAAHMGKRFVDPFGVNDEVPRVEQMMFTAVKEVFKEHFALAQSEIKDLNRKYVELRDSGASPEELAAIGEEIRRIQLEVAPVTMEIARIVGKETLWIQDRQEFYRKLEEEPAEILSDIVSAVSSAFSGGAAMAGQKAPKLAQILNKIAEGVDWADPMMWPQKGVRAADRIRKPESAEGFKPESAEAAEKYGAGKEMTPDTVLNPNLETREYLMGGLEGKPGIDTRQRLDRTVEAIDETKKRMTDNLAQGVDPYNAEVAGKSVLNSYQERQFDDKVRFKEMFQEIRTHFTDEIPAGVFSSNATGRVYESFNWRKNLDETLAELDSSEINKADLNKIRSAIDDILKDKDIKTLNGLDEFRTEFRQRMITQFRKREVNAIGSGTMSEKVYNAITNDLYNSIEATVTASGGRLPDDLLAQVKHAKADYRDLKVLEDTAGGKFLIQNQDKPAELINGLLGNTLATDEIQNVYKLIGSEAAQDIQATMMNQMFQKASSGPLGLKREIEKMTKNNPDRIVELFGGGDRGQEIAADLSAFADFIASTERVRMRDRGTITGRANQMLAGGAAVGGTHMAMSIAHALVGSGDIVQAATFGASLAAASLGGRGYIKWATSDIGRKRLREGLGDEKADMFFKALGNATQRGVVKSLDIGGLTDDEKNEGQHQ